MITLEFDMRLIVFVVSFFFCQKITAQVPTVSAGKMIRHDSFPSQLVDTRKIDVWLPPAYSANKKYPVLYMHDGQMLFDSNTTWNKQEWQVDEVMQSLLAGNAIRECIVVGVWNNGAYRHSEYFPAKPVRSLPHPLSDSIITNELKGKVQADNYLKFLVTELKPFIDRTYSTLKDRSNTFVAGSSMGGLISMYAICEYPKVFGGAACISTHWIGSLKRLDKSIPEAFNNYLQQHLPSPKTHKIYFDYGTATLDSFYKPYQQMVDVTMRKKGYSTKSWITKEFPGEAHTEKAWAARLHEPLLFLLKK